MPDDKRGARPSAPASRPPPQTRPPVAPSISPSLEDSDLPLPSDRRAGSSFKALAPFAGALAEKLEELQQSELPEEQLIQFHRMAFGALAAFIAIQALSPTAVPALWWAFISQPLLLHFPSNLIGGFWYVLGVALWLSYGAYHVTQGALLGRTNSRWPWSPARTFGLAMIPFYNLYGSWVLFTEALQRLGREADQEHRANQARSALLGALALIGVTWALQLTSDLGVDIPDIAIQSAAWARAAAELATLGLAFSMMVRVIRKVAEEGSVEPEEGESSSPLSRGTAGPAPAFTATVLVLLLGFGITVYYARREALQCPNGATISTTVLSSGQRVLYCSKDGFADGPWRVRSKSGTEQFTYSRGSISGPYTSWYASGQTKETGFLVGDKKQGSWVKLSEAGATLEESSYTENELDGRSRKYFPNGKVAEERNYLAGKPTGKYVAFHETGRKAEEGQYKNGSKIGHWISWSPSGLVVDEKDYAAPTKGQQQAAAEPGANGTPPATPGETGPAAVPTAPVAALPVVTEKRFFAGHTPEWWGDRLTRVKQRVETGDLDAKVYELTKKRAQANGLEVMDGQAEVKVRIDVSTAAPQGGRP